MFDRAGLCDAVADKGRVARVVIAAIAGSSPREVGAAMLVWADGQSGTIGGGALEYAATLAARDALTANAPDQLTRHPLGPELGQCCGGAVTLLTEVYDASRLDEVPETGAFARGKGAKPLAIFRAETDLRNAGAPVTAGLHGSWFIEPILTPDFQIWIWGAGHVGRALVHVLAPLPGMAITWVDTAAARFPDAHPTSVTVVPVADPTALMPHAPKTAHHLILTYSHALDLALCHAALTHGFASAGLIGSATKWARFRSRLAALGHRDAQIARITCPIGDPGLGKHPHAIAVGVAARYLNRTEPQTAARENRA
ncbi:xanthine dehydrogenase accessory protein XdhC [Marinovum sp. 2_MG-2023]|uniref:xanthine dehydrogenase accessory protein XdhC n=1 Tax=unclassified Marinovum TaxID=2647166 RepID=UPI0026E3CDA2|nr:MULTISPECIES: xanthine dehydrogenase accessory protein XdhC [unclassified Marinovum]MDO6729643.1 xanthine dehydrogenase accessory protein XdhC [Marinovum sp. 2_MG-2023]MDO6779457.1 xanthine dehydrogenase accessory protein XdhC [Marinovum sp. 1_MG-2023]